MTSFAYKFFYNSEAVGFSDGLGFFRKNHERVPSLDGFIPGDELTLAWEGSIDVAVGGNDQDAIDCHVCEQLFSLFNAPWERPIGYVGPSLSVGDVVVLFPGTPEQVVYAAEPVGFKRVPDGIFAIGTILQPTKPQPSRWVRPADQFKDYLKAKRADGVFLTEEEERIAYGGN